MILLCIVWYDMGFRIYIRLVDLIPTDGDAHPLSAFQRDGLRFVPFLSGFLAAGMVIWID